MGFICTAVRVEWPGELNRRGADPVPTLSQSWRTSDGCERSGREGGNDEAIDPFQEGDEGSRTTAQAGAKGLDPAEAGQRPDPAPGGIDALRRGEARGGIVRATEPESTRGEPSPGAAPARRDHRAASPGEE